MERPIIHRWYPANELRNWSIQNGTHLELMFPVSSSTILWSDHSHEYLNGLLIWRVISFPKKKVTKTMKGWINPKEAFKEDINSFWVSKTKCIYDAIPITLTYEVEE